MSALRLTSGRLQLSENDVERQICDFMSQRGWRCRKQHTGRFKSLDGQRWIVTPREQLGEPDWLFMRGIIRWPPPHYLLVEVKTEGAALSEVQARWHLFAKSEGMPVYVTNSIEDWARTYYSIFPRERMR